MRIRTQVLLLVLLAAVVGVSSALARGDPKPFTVTSTLDGRAVLPLRIRWKALPQHVPLAQIREVDYLIDGRRAWVEHHPPYFYGSNEGSYGNWLVTSFLTPGVHIFTVRAVTRSGKTATDTLKARVLPAPSPPAKLAGAWTRMVTASDLKKGPPGPPAGRWTITITSSAGRSGLVTTSTCAISRAATSSWGPRSTHRVDRAELFAASTRSTSGRSRCRETTRA
jgi:hypothetical protein